MHRRKQWTEDAPVFAFTVEGFATAHNIGRSTAYNEIKALRLKARKVNGRTIITAEDAAEWRANLPLASEAAA